MLYWYVYLKATLQDPCGQAMTEYATILGLVLLAAAGAFSILGGDILGIYDGINHGMDSTFETKTWFSG
jgi:Flp pilus assembly pilin Flp